MAGKKGSSVQEVVKRQNTLAKIIDQWETTGKRYKDADLLHELDLKGFTIDERTLYRDKVSLAKSDTFVADLSSSLYSKRIHDVFDRLDRWRERIQDWEKTPPTVQRIVTSPAVSLTPIQFAAAQKAGNLQLIVKEITNETISPITLMEMGMRLDRMELQALGGDVIDIGVQEMGQMMDEIEDTNRKVTMENQKLKSQMELLEKEKKSYGGNTNQSGKNTSGKNSSAI